MREIKFRAWNKSNNRMMGATQKIQDYFTIRCDGEVSASDDLILMQYTCLKDKNGVEIFEGDIVKMFDIEITESDYSQSIIFYHGSFGYMTSGKHSYFVSIAGNTNINFNGDSMDVEVIGNIYENEELLNA